MPDFGNKVNTDNPGLFEQFIQMSKHPCILLGLLLIQLPAWGQIQEFQAAVSAYNAGNYEQAVAHGEAFIKTNTTSPEARYYLANSYLKLNKPDLAKVQYQFCLKMAPNTEAGRLSRKALAELTKYPKVASPPATGATVADASDSAGEPKQLNRAILTQCRERQDKIISDANNTVSRIHEDTSRAISRIHQREEEDIRSLSKYLYDEKGHRYDNPDYPHQVEFIRSEAKRLEKIATDREAFSTQMALKEAQAKANSIGNIGPTFSSQLIVGRNGNSRLTTVGTTLHARNYMNFSGDPPDSQYPYKKVTPSALIAPPMQKLLPIRKTTAPKASN